MNNRVSESLFSTHAGHSSNVWLTTPLHRSLIPPSFVPLQEMVSIFNRIVRSHDKQLKDAVVTLTKPQMDRIVRKNHEKFR